MDNRRPAGGCSTLLAGRLGVFKQALMLGIGSAGGATAWAATVVTNAATAPMRLHDIKGPIDIRSPWAWVRVALVLLVLGGLLAAAWWWWKRKGPAAPDGPGESPADRARRRLTAALDVLHDPERFATRVSEVVRTYLEERFGLHAPERTTEEFLAELSTSASLDTRHKAVLEGFLTRCDLVKFARAEPGPTELTELHDAASRLVEETSPVAVVPPPPIQGTPGGVS